MKKLAVVVTIVVLVLVYLHIDVSVLLQRLRGMHLAVFCLALGFFVPQILVTAWRWRYMVWDICPMGTLEAVELILAGKALNAFVPSKLGEMSKAYFLKTRSGLDLARGGALVLLEKLLDVAGLCLVLLTGIVLAPRRGPLELSVALLAVLVLIVAAGACLLPTRALQRRLPARGKLWQRLGTLLEGWNAILESWRRHGWRLGGIAALSVALWFLHLGQIYLFFVALHSSVPVQLVFAYVPMSIFVGLLPLTIGGMGTRDSALILLFAPYESAAVMAGIGLLCSLRYWVDTLLGLPFFHRYAFDTRHEA